VGFCGIFKHFSRFEFFLLSNRIHARPHAGNANRWQELALNLLRGFQIGVLSLANQDFGFWQSFGFVKVGIFSGGCFPSFGFSKIGSCFWFKKFRVKLAQVSEIGFKFFNLGFGKQAVSFGKVCFFSGSRSFWQNQVSKIGFKVFRKSFGKFGLGFLARLVFSSKVHFS
jgi:hypothetical protein